MLASVYHIPGMDCPSEENIIRLALQDNKNIKGLTFDIPKRSLVVYHIEYDDSITQKLATLNFGAKKIKHYQVVDAQIEKHDEAKQIQLLYQVLGINASFFVIEAIAGWLSKSMGLMADGLDMLADSFVYGLSLWAIGKAANTKNNIAALSGYAQLFLAVFGIFEVARRFVSQDYVPNYFWMIVISIFALIGNALCLYLLQKSKSNEAHMRASMIFTSNDIWVNAGVIVAGVAVLITGQRWADLIIGSIVFLIVAKGAVSIIKISRAKV